MACTCLLVRRLARTGYLQHNNRWTIDEIRVVGHGRPIRLNDVNAADQPARMASCGGPREYRPVGD